MSAKAAPAKPAAPKPAATKAATPAAKPAAKTGATPAAKAVVKTAAKAPADTKAAPKVAAKAAETKPDVADTTGEEAHHANGEEKKKSRQQITSVLHINISSARVATHLKEDLGDAVIEAQIKDHRVELKKAKQDKDTTKEKAIKARITELSKGLVRLSSECPIATATAMDGLVKELLHHGMNQALAADEHLVEVDFLHEGFPQNLVFYPLFDKCPTWENYDPEYEQTLRVERLAANKAAKEARESRKLAEEKKTAAGAEEKKVAGKGKAPAKAVHADVVEPADEATEEHHREHTKTTFITYIENALKAVKKDEAYRSMRVSNRLREYLSDLVAEILQRIASLSRIVVLEIADVRTMNANHTKAVIHMLMADAGRNDDQINSVKILIDEKLEVYRAHIKAEKEKKNASLSADKKVEQERKRVESEFARKSKQVELAKKRAEDALKKADTLTKETATLAPIVEANKKVAEEEAAKKAEETAAKKAEESAAAPAEPVAEPAAEPAAKPAAKPAAEAVKKAPAAK